MLQSHTVALKEPEKKAGSVGGRARSRGDRERDLGECAWVEPSLLLCPKNCYVGHQDSQQAEWRGG